MTTISPTITSVTTPTDAVIIVPIATLDSFLPIWSRAISASAVKFASCPDDPSSVTVTIERGFASYREDMKAWFPTVVLPLSFLPYWMDSPSASA